MRAQINGWPHVDTLVPRIMPNVSEGSKHCHFAACVLVFGTLNKMFFFFFCVKQTTYFALECQERGRLQSVQAMTIW